MKAAHLTDLSSNLKANVFILHIRHITCISLHVLQQSCNSVAWIFSQTPVTRQPLDNANSYACLLIVLIANCSNSELLTVWQHQVIVHYPEHGFLLLYLSEVCSGFLSVASWSEELRRLQNINAGDNKVKTVRILKFRAAKDWLMLSLLPD